MTRKTTLAVLLVVVAVIAAGVIGSYAYANARRAASQNPEATSTTTVTTATSTSVTASSTVVVPGTPSKPPTTKPTPTPSNPGMVTQSDNGKTVTFTQGQRFGVAMGDTLQWSLSFNPTGIVTRVPNIMTVRGEQGVYTATTVGTTVLHATGAPICNTGEACPQFLQQVTVTIKVTPAPVTTTGTVSGSVLLGPTCPVERNPPDPACAPKGYQTSIRILIAVTRAVYKTVSIDASGAFAATLPAGNYIFAPVGGSTLPHCSETDVTVTKGQTQTLNLDCDTGIR